MTTKTKTGRTVLAVAVDEPAEGESGTIYEYHVIDSGHLIAVLYDKTLAFELAAAPELLEAARLAVERYCGCHGKNDDGSEFHGEGCARPKLRAAIAKAEGR